MRGRLVLAGLCASLAAACSTTVAGSATYAGGPAPSGTASGGSGPTGGPSESPPVSPSGQPTRRSLSCRGGKVVSPAGSPYCYLVPAGFVDVSSSVTVTTSVGSERFRSAVAVAARDLVIVTVYELRRDADGISDSALETELAGVLTQLSKQGFEFDSTTAERSTVDGARSFGYHAREAKNQLQTDVYFIFKGRTEVEVNCQWQQKQADVVAGCRKLMASLQVKSVK
jgi:hypothetical protein